MTEKTVIIGGASGLVGTSLTSFLTSAGYNVKRLVRRTATSADEIEWHPNDGEIDSHVLEGATAVINLSGASVGRLPWTKKYRRAIINSRVRSTNTLTEAIARCENPPQVFISASACGYYGDAPGKTLTEKSTRDAETFLAQVTGRWEKAAQKASPYSRVVIIRNATILAKGQGGLAPLEFFAKCFLLPTIGGKQHWPWISLEDATRAIEFLITHDIEGPVNMAAPNQNTMKEITRALADALKRPSFIRLPKWSAYIAGQGGYEVLAMDQKVIPQTLLDHGFDWNHPTIDEAMASLYQK